MKNEQTHQLLCVKTANLAKNENAQALVELVIILTVIMGMCAGMIYVHRLLTIQYWAQQEARLTAFEEDWVAKDGRALGVASALDNLPNDNWFHRPSAARDASVTRNLEHNPSRPGMNDVFARANIQQERNDGFLGDSGDSNGEIMLADEDSGLISSAYASQTSPVTQPSNMKKTLLSHIFDGPRVGIKRVEGFIHVLHETGFGGRYCSAMRGVSERHGVAPNPIFLSEDCPQYFDRDFGEYLATNGDFVSLFDDMNYQMKEGISRDGAIRISAQRAIARGFYSYFDQKVASARSGAGSAIALGNLEGGLSVVDSDYLTMLTDMRYVGSIVAMGSVALGIEKLSTHGGMSQNYTAMRNFERSIENILDDDASSNYPVAPVDGFWMTIYNVLPIPDLAAITGGLFDGIAYNVFSKEGDSDEIFDEDSLIKDSSVLTQVNYDSQGVLFKAAKSRFDTSGRVMSAKFYLLTQPWHINRRALIPGGADYRDLGTQLDDASGSTDEAVLRRRIFGLYIFPSEPTDFLRPLTGVIPELDPVLDAFDAVDSVIGVVKNFVFDNPLNDVLDFISQLPGIDLSDFKLPEFPAVRPQAYPRTVEIENDKLAGTSRKFSDYIKEQKDNNPKPDPTFH